MSPWISLLRKQATTHHPPMLTPYPLRRSITLQTMNIILREYCSESIILQADNSQALDLQSCQNLTELKLAHSNIIQRDTKPSLYRLNTLMIMYSKLHTLKHARHVFDQISEKNVVTWTAMISAYTKNPLSNNAIELYLQMKRTGNSEPNKFTLSSILPAFADVGCLNKSMEIHTHVIKSGLSDNLYISSCMGDVYLKSRSPEFARKVFDKMPTQSIVTWNSMLSGYVQNGELMKAEEVFRSMPERDLMSWNSMISGYGQLGFVEEAIRMFNECELVKDLVSWTSVITVCAQNGFNEKALEFFSSMQRHGIRPNCYTLTGALQGCANLGRIDRGREIHGQIIRCGMSFNVFANSALVYLYGKCGMVDEAGRIFERMTVRNNISWNAIVMSHAQNGNLAEAERLFGMVPEKTVVSWNCMIAGFAQDGLFDRAIELYHEMQVSGVCADLGTFASLLPAFSQRGSLDEGRQVHCVIVRSGLDKNVFVGSGLVDMYGKCGSLDDAEKVFGKFRRRDLVLWTSMAVTYATHGLAAEALAVFARMEESGIRPNRVTFTGILSACCRAGLVDHGLHYFDKMTNYYHIVPSTEHYCCMVDLLGKAGLLKEALDFIKRIPVKAELVIWGALLSACKIHGDVELGEEVARQLFEMVPAGAASFIGLSDTDESDSKSKDNVVAEKVIKEKGAKRGPQYSWSEVHKHIQSFLSGSKPNMGSDFSQ